MLDNHEEFDLITSNELNGVNRYLGTSDTRVTKGTREVKGSSCIYLECMGTLWVNSLIISLAKSVDCPFS
jgi:hypothetical protein